MPAIDRKNPDAQTKAWMDTHDLTVTFTPTKTVELSVDGFRVTFTAGEETKVPVAHRELYRNLYGE